MNLRDNLIALYDFYMVAKEKSFSRAAEKNFIAQPNLSRRVQNLEKDLKLKLINSSNKGIELTLDGEKLFKQLDQLFSNFELFHEIDNNLIKGVITIGTTRNIADNKLEKYLSDFNKKYPDVKIKILIDSATNLNSYLMNHQIDILIDYLPHINYSEKLELEVKPIGEFQTCFACSKSLWNKNNQSIKTISDLSKFKLVIPGSSRRRQLLDEVLQKKGIELNPDIEMPDSKLMIDFVKNNDDYIGYFIKDEIQNSELCELSIPNLPVNSIGIIYAKNTINNITKKFVEMILNDSMEA